MIHKKILLLFFLFLSIISFGQKSDSILSRKSLFLIPNASYQQETSVAFGLALGYYFKSNQINRISSISGSATYTVLNQFIFNITPKLFFGDKKWYLYTNLNYRNFPDYYYGISANSTNLKQAYTAKIFSLNIQPQYALTKNIYLGCLLNARFENALVDSTFNINKSKIEPYGFAGWQAYKQTSFGAVASYDSRDNQFYPTKGFFAKTMVSTSFSGWFSDYSAQEVTLDFRQYIPVYKSHILAWQALFTGVFSKSEIPFQLLPSLGGRDLMRGFRQGMYRENGMFLLQTEYRLPIYKRLKGAVFCSAGDVFNENAYLSGKLKIAYGAGLRYRLNDARVHLRFDLAKNNYGDKLQFYITATEAF